MDTRPDREAAPGLADLIGNALRHAAELVRSEAALMRAEIAQNLRGLAIALVLMVMAAVFAIIALGLAVEALVAGLTPILGSEGAAAIVCAVGAGIIALALFIAGYRRFRLDALYPDRAATSVQQDVRLIQRRAM